MKRYKTILLITAILPACLDLSFQKENKIRRAGRDLVGLPARQDLFQLMAGGAVW